MKAITIVLIISIKRYWDSNVVLKHIGYIYTLTGFEALIMPR